MTWGEDEGGTVPPPPGSLPGPDPLPEAGEQQHPLLPRAVLGMGRQGGLWGFPHFREDSGQP